MRLNKIFVSNFRNISSCTLEFHPTLNIFYGDNGQGKTNILEGIYFLSGSKSFRGNKDLDCIKKGEEFYHISADFLNQKEDRIQLSFSEKQKKISFNNISKKNKSDILGKFSSVIFSPTDLSIIKDTPEMRRKFLDYGIMQIKPPYHKLLKEYKKVLNQKNFLLKTKTQSPSFDALIDVYNQQLAQLGTAIHCTRNNFLKELNPFAIHLYSGISNQQETLKLSYISTIFPKDTSINYTPDWVDFYYQKLTQKKEQEINYKSATLGIQKDDIAFFIDDMDCKIFASQGQQRSVMIVLKLAMASVYQKINGSYPVVLLDDVMSELDYHRIHFLLHHLQQMQVFITCCDSSYFDTIKSHYKLFQIQHGSIKMETER